MASSIVVDFPNGRTLKRPSLRVSRGRSVADIVRCLSGSPPPADAGPDRPVPIRLSEFAGIADPVVRQLCSLALAGIVTPASAGRLALRHAEEVYGPQPTRPRVQGAAAEYQLALTGDPFGDFAFHIRGRSGWIAFAPVESLGLLMESSSRDRVQVCMLVGCDADRCSTVWLMTAGEWRRSAVALSRGVDSRGCRHVLLLGGLPSREPGRSVVLIEIEQALRRGGNTRLIASTLRKSCGADSPDPARDSVRDLLTMIELTFPGLVDVAVSSGGCSR